MIRHPLKLKIGVSQHKSTGHCSSLSIEQATAISSIAATQTAATQQHRLTHRGQIEIDPQRLPRNDNNRIAGMDRPGIPGLWWAVDTSLRTIAADQIPTARQQVESVAATRFYPSRVLRWAAKVPLPVFIGLHPPSRSSLSHLQNLTKDPGLWLLKRRASRQR